MEYSSVSLPMDAESSEGRVRFLGLDFDALDVPALVEATERHVKLKKPLAYVVTPNVDHMVRLEAEPELKPLYGGAGFNVCDSRILEVLARFDGKSLPAAPGADVVEYVLRNRVAPDDRIVVIGSTPDVIDALSRDFGFTNIAWHEPPMGLRHNPEAVDFAARFLVERNEGYAFLCVGSPQQEMIAAKAVEMGGGTGIALCCGASLDFLTGKVTRAPLWMRKNRLEWLHRLFSEPGRLWKRYLVDGPRILRIWLKYRGH